MENKDQALREAVKDLFAEIRLDLKHPKGRCGRISLPTIDKLCTAYEALKEAEK
jgi:hypothetical protein